MYLVSHAESALGGRVAAKLLCSGARVRVFVPQRPLHSLGRRQLSKLRTSGAEVARGGLVAADIPIADAQITGAQTDAGLLDPKLLPILDPGLGDVRRAERLCVRAWRGVDTAVYLPASNVRCGKEVVGSLGDVGTLAFVQAAVAAGVRRVVLLDTTLFDRATLRRLREVRVAAQQGAVELVLLEPALPPEHTLEITLAHGCHARLAERRRLLVFWPLQGLADAAARAATATTLRSGPILLPAEVRRYSDVLETAEVLMAKKALSAKTVSRNLRSCKNAYLEDALWGEVVLGGPLKVVTAGMARSLGLEFPAVARYLKAVSGAP